MKERERNKRLMVLIQKLHSENDVDSLELLKTLVDNDTEAMKKSFEIMLKQTPLAFLFGADKLADLGLESKA
mgnify:CR=1 FL=1